MGSRIDEDDDEEIDNEINIDFPLSVFADMDVEHLFSDDDDDDHDKDELNNSPLNFRTCPTTPASAIRKDCSRSLNNLTGNYNSSIHRHHSMTIEH